MEKKKPLTFDQLLDFVVDPKKMRMSSHYQPVMIARLAEANGSMTKRDLALELLEADADQVANAERVLMRWPKDTLTYHGVVVYDSKKKEFRLNLPKLTEAQKLQLITACESRLVGWVRSRPKMSASARYEVLELARGRCQACGVLASRRPLDVDHIIPKSKARSGKVRSASGDWIPVNSVENLQVLCSKCNRGKRNQGSMDFRPDKERIADAIAESMHLAETNGHDPDLIIKMAKDRYRRSRGKKRK